MEGELLGGELGREPGQGGGVACACAVFLDDGAQGGVAVEGDPGDSCALSDGDKGDRLAACG